MPSRAIVPSPLIWFAYVFALLPACKSTAHLETSSPPAPAAHADAEREVGVERDKLALARMQLEIARKKDDDARTRKERELEFARDELAQFDAVDAPNRIARANLDLARHQDAVFEQEEELAQLDMMYEKESLADKTREIVLTRGKRRVERAKADLAISESEAKALETRTIPRERAKLALEVELKTSELAWMKSETDEMMIEKRMAVEAAEAALHAAETKAGPTT